jgi:hypothetical protein
MGYQQHYAKLFERLEAEYGALDPDTLTAIVGFSAGGPVSLCERKAARLFVTCELSLYQEQKTSTDGLKFELFCKDEFNEAQARSLFTGLGALSMEAQLGDKHTVDASEIMQGEIGIVRLNLFSRVMIEGMGYGLYRVGADQVPHTKR